LTSIFRYPVKYVSIQTEALKPEGAAEIYKTGQRQGCRAVHSSVALNLFTQGFPAIGVAARDILWNTGIPIF
jgi:hypothetical protein